MTTEKTNLKPQPDSPGSALVAAGDWAALQRQLGEPESLCCLTPSSALLGWRQVQNAAELRVFLLGYRDRLLAPLELPAVRRAFDHACRGEARELIALDRELATRAALQPFAEASKFVGRHHLKSLKPLRGQRVVPKYIAAVENGDASGWNTTVYGLILGVYAFPLRQGLIRYAEQTVGGFVASASEKFLLTEGARQTLQEEVLNPIPSIVEQVIGPAGFSVVN